MKPKHQRLIFVTVSVIFLCAAALMTMQAFRQNLVFFYSPGDLAQQNLAAGQRIRVGGLVGNHSIKRGRDDTVRFTITDGAAEIHVTYKGLLPNLFREGQGVVAEGTMEDKDHFTATSILAKHDEKYMPREVVDALKKSGQWKGQ